MPPGRLRGRGGDLRLATDPPQREGEVARLRRSGKLRQMADDSSPTPANHRPQAGQEVLTDDRLRIAVFVAAGLMILGAIGPWASVNVFGTAVTANGFDRDGRRSRGA